MDRPSSRRRPDTGFLATLICCIGLAFATNALAVSPGTAPVNPPTGGFAIEGNLQANVSLTGTNDGIGDWLPGVAGAGGNVLNAAGTPLFDSPGCNSAK